MNGDHMSDFCNSNRSALFPNSTLCSFALVFFCMSAGSVYAQGLTKPATIQPSINSPGRNTFLFQAEELVQRYNLVMSQIERKMTLPPADQLNRAGKNDNFHVLDYAVSPSIKVQFEVDNTNGKPFSINLISAPKSTEDVGNLVAVMAAFGAAVFGKGETAGVVAKTCTAAQESKEKTAEITVQKFKVFCSSVLGGWIAGISVPKVLPANFKQ